jgi:excinuclease ABC subunit C
LKNKDKKETSFDGAKVARRLSTAPGVYRMLAEEGRVLYVGKASNLRKRVGSYFGRSPANTRTLNMLAQVRAIEVSITRTEGEALLLENDLIKSLKPRYNVLLRDDKSYPMIYLSSEDEFPRLAFHRGPRRLPGRYFGPFPSAHGVRDSLNLMQKLFRVRQCEDSFFSNRSRPCLQHQIRRCTGPCVGLIDRQDYARDVRHATLFLDGQSHKVIEDLIAQMDRASDALEFEQAAALRDQIAALKRVQTQQHVAGVSTDMDIVAAFGTGGVACVQVFFFRQGRNLGNRSFFPRNSGAASQSDVLQAFVSQYYLRHQAPRELVVNGDLPDKLLLAEVLGERAGHKFKIISRPRGEKLKWLQMAGTNAEAALKVHLATHAGQRKRLVALQKLLQLEELPSRMECFDISHTQGEATVASCVVFDADGPVKSEYRRFNIKDIEPGDDYAAMHQALSRRYKRLVSAEGKIPDVLFIDGGKGQVTQALEIMDEYQIDQTLVVGVSKGPERRAGHETLLLGRARKELFPGPESIASHLIQQIRDEAHRFAISGHRQRRGKTRQRSQLQEIPGVGAKRRRSLLRHFGGLQGLMAAGVEDLEAIDGISNELAQRIYDALH